MGGGWGRLILNSKQVQAPDVHLVLHWRHGQSVCPGDKEVRWVLGEGVGEGEGGGAGGGGATTA